jgi:hypothetical protein
MQLEEGEWKPIKIPRNNMTYVLKLTQHISFVTRPRPHSQGQQATQGLTHISPNTSHA